MAKIVPTEKARQGRRGTQMLVVLVCALILAAAVWAGLEFYGESIAPNEAEIGQPATP